MLLIVRHAMPIATEEVEPAAWPLGPEGLRAAARLTAILPRDGHLVASTEPKAWQTLATTPRTGDGVVLERRFGEVERPAEPWGPAHRALRLDYVAGSRPTGWERHQDVAARFSSAVADHTARAGGRPLVVGTHGMALTTWLVGCGVLTQDQAVDFWEDLRFPDCLAVDLVARTVARRA